jgi:hypothetical protein
VITPNGADLPKNTLYPAAEKGQRKRIEPKQPQALAARTFAAGPGPEKMSTEAVDKSVDSFVENPYRAPCSHPFCTPAYFLPTSL